jgi:ATP-dependent helicase/nuclease subunit B
MDGVELLPVEIVAALERGATVVTGNQRAARTLRRMADERNRKSGLASWKPAAVVAWDTWLASLWRELMIKGHVSQTLLNRFQEHAVWRTVLEADADLASLRTVDSLAEMAAEAWSLLCSYNGVRRLRGAHGSGDTRSFQRWAGVFEQICRSERILPQAQLEEALGVTLDAGFVTLPASGVVLVGFDTMTPAQTKFVEAARSAGVHVEIVQPAVETAQRMLVEADDEQEELYRAAAWIRKSLESRPESKIALIVPGLETQRSEIDRV